MKSWIRRFALLAVMGSLVGGVVMAGCSPAEEGAPEDGAVPTEEGAQPTTPEDAPPAPEEAPTDAPPAP